MSGATWCFYEEAENRANFATVESFFVEVGGEIVDPCFTLTAPAGRRHPTGSSELVALGVWKEIKPTEIQTDERYETRSETIAREIGSIRAAYRHF